MKNYRYNNQRKLELVEPLREIRLAGEETNQVSADLESNISQLGFNLQRMAAHINAG